MPFVPVANVAEVEIRMLLDGQKVENTLWFENAGAVTALNMGILTTALYDWWDTYYKPLTWNGTQLREIYAVDQTTNTGPTNTLSGGGLVGTGGANAASNNVSVTVSFRTDLRGRSFRGRNYMLGLPLTILANQNQITAGYAADLITAYTALVGPGAFATGWTWGVASRFSGVDADGDPIPRVAGVFTPITSVVITDLIVDSQRRRLPARGT